MLAFGSGANSPRPPPGHHASAAGHPQHRDVGPGLSTGDHSCPVQGPAFDIIAAVRLGRVGDPSLPSDRRGGTTFRAWVRRSFTAVSMRRHQWGSRSQFLYIATSVRVPDQAASGARTSVHRMMEVPGDGPCPRCVDRVFVYDRPGAGGCPALGGYTRPRLRSGRRAVLAIRGM